MLKGDVQTIDVLFTWFREKWKLVKCKKGSHKKSNWFRCLRTLWKQTSSWKHSEIISFFIILKKLSFRTLKKKCYSVISNKEIMFIDRVKLERVSLLFRGVKLKYWLMSNLENQLKKLKVQFVFNIGFG